MRRSTETPGLDARTLEYWEISQKVESPIWRALALQALCDLAFDETQPKLRAAMLRRLNAPAMGGALDGGNAA
jgi:hypothetical protein